LCLIGLRLCIVNVCMWLYVRLSVLVSHPIKITTIRLVCVVCFNISLSMMCMWCVCVILCIVGVGMDFISYVHLSVCETAGASSLYPSLYLALSIYISRLVLYFASVTIWYALSLCLSLSLFVYLSALPNHMIPFHHITSHTHPITSYPIVCFHWTDPSIML
jgi:hypothetical protein